jgi:hypothetical protein
MHVGSMPHIVKKLSMKGYNFVLNLISIRGLHKKLWVSKMAKIPISRVMGFSTWESWKKHHLDVALMSCH